ncbi:MAG: glutamate racemase, partial [Zetaproteobacteria bacterium]
RPIGILDSGIGGLTVVSEIRALLPHEHLVYLADQSMIPYGNKDEAWIRERALLLAHWLHQEQGIKILVIACNTATAAAITALRQTLPFPVVGMEPAVKPASRVTRNRRIGILATEGTLKSARFSGLLRTFAEGMQVFTQPCIGLVEAIEQGDRERIDKLLADHVKPLLHQQVDTIVLGCTHYPLVRSHIEALAGPDITIIETGAAVAQQTRRQLLHHALKNPSDAQPSLTLFSTSSADKLRKAVERMLPHYPPATYGCARLDDNSSVTDSKASS